MNIKKLSFISLALVTGLGALFAYVSFMSDANENNEGKKAIVIGASSGIGKEVAKLLAKKGFNVGLVGRRTHLLETVQHEIPTKSYVKTIDIAKTEEAISLLNQLIDQMGGLDVMIIMAGAYSQFNPDKEWDSTKNLIDVDIKGFSAMALTAMQYFEKQKSGLLVAVSSIAALRGLAHAPSYSAVKAYASILLEGLRNRMIQKNIPVYVTELIPGWVDVEHTKFSELPGTFWVASTQEAAQQIYEAIKTKKKKAYIIKRWAIIAWFLKLAPDWLFNLLWK